LQLCSKHKRRGLFGSLSFNDGDDDDEYDEDDDYADEDEDYSDESDSHEREDGLV